MVVLCAKISILCEVTKESAFYLSSFYIYLSIV